MADMKLRLTAAIARSAFLSAVVVRVVWRLRPEVRFILKHLLSQPSAQAVDDEDRSSGQYGDPNDGRDFTD